ncbi:MAG TPA: hypothetical protein VFF58_00360 [Candidatus Nitrosotalea sp.]|nr:hypothetical protein [Candidatus Nitrosotalea sp.]
MRTETCIAVASVWTDGQHLPSRLLLGKRSRMNSQMSAAPLGTVASQ